MGKFKNRSTMTAAIAKIQMTQNGILEAISMCEYRHLCVCVGLRRMKGIKWFDKFPGRWNSSGRD